MTRATFVRKDGLLCGFTLRGHAGAGVSGTDVVCAAISSAAYLAANTITEICRCPADTEAQDGFLMVSVEEPAGCQDILLGLRLHLGQLQQQYPRQLVVETIEAR